MISHVIFDCDGVLIDSEVISMDVDVALLAQNGIHLSWPTCITALSAPPLKTW